MGSSETMDGGPRSVERSIPPGKLSPGPGLAQQDVAAHQLARIRQATTAIVAEQGYEALKVRDIVCRAEVSTRAFYEHFASKEDCFLRTSDLIAGRATRRIIAAQVGERDWRERSRLVCEEFFRGLERKPDEARLTLVEACGAGTTSLEQAWRAERIFEEMLAECLARAPGGVEVPPLIVEGIVSGIASISRNYLAVDRMLDLSALSAELLRWALSYPDQGALELDELDRHSVGQDTALEPLPASLRIVDDQPRSSSGDRALILASMAELAAAHGYAGITAPRVCSAAGVSRKKFNAHFDDREDCYLAAIDHRAGRSARPSHSGPRRCKLPGRGRLPSNGSALRAHRQ